MAGISASAISWLKPMGRTITSSPVAIRPATEYSAWLRPAGACGKLSSAHRITVVSAIVVPARFRKIHARLHSPIAMSRRRGI